MVYTSKYLGQWYNQNRYTFTLVLYKHISTQIKHAHQVYQQIPLKYLKLYIYLLDYMQHILTRKLLKYISIVIKIFIIIILRIFKINIAG